MRKNTIHTCCKHGLNIIGDITENSPVPLWCSRLSWQGLDLDALDDGLRHLRLTWVKDGTTESLVSVNFAEIVSFLWG